MQREESSCAEHCFNCDLRLAFSSSNFLKFSFDCSPIKETKPRWRCYLRLLQKPLLLPSHTAPVCTPCISGLLCPPHLSFSPSLPSLLKSEHPQPLFPTRPSWAQVWPWILNPEASQILLTIFSFFFSSCRNISSSCCSNFSCSLLFFNCSCFSSSNLVSS